MDKSFKKQTSRIISRCYDTTTIAMKIFSNLAKVKLLQRKGLEYCCYA